jgi:UTP--glucose-1-phosphate uridylyltransferase
MIQKIRKAVIPAAGLGTRMLPASKAIPKEMIPIVDKPAIQYIVEEAVKSGITEILIITNHGKNEIEDHFDRNFELEQRLLAGGDTKLYNSVVECASMANIFFIRQKETKGLGHAVSCARSFIGNEPFAVLYGDDVIASETPVTKQLIDAYEKYGKCVVGAKEVPTEVVLRGSSLKVEKIEGSENLYNCTDMAEKVANPDLLYSNFTILGRCVLTPEIFDMLDKTAPGAKGEIQLTDAIAAISRKSGTIAVDFEGNRFDMGNKLGVLQAIVETAYHHPELGERFKKYLKDFVEKNQ